LHAVQLAHENNSIGVADANQPGVMHLLVEGESEPFQQLLERWSWGQKLTRANQALLAKNARPLIPKAIGSPYCMPVGTLIQVARESGRSDLARRLGRNFVDPNNNVAEGRVDVLTADGQPTSECVIYAYECALQGVRVDALMAQGMSLGQALAVYVDEQVKAGAIGGPATGG
jgi:hypothetical protein